MLDFLVRLQGQIHAAISADLSAFAEQRDWRLLAAMLPVGILFGALHALTPGHGKAVLASYMLGSRIAAARAAFVAILMALIHIGAAVLLALIAAPLVTRTLVGVGRAPSLEFVSRVLLLAIGLWLVIRAFRTKPHVKGEGVAVSLAGGLIPCPLTLFVMFYALSRGVPEAGMAFAGAMAAGVAATLTAVALIAIFARQKLLSLGAWAHLPFDKVVRTLNALAGLAIIAIAGRALLA